MAITPLYSAQDKPNPTTLVYDKLSKELRIQIIQILEDGIGHILVGDDAKSRAHYEKHNNETVRAVYKHVERLLCREYGKDSLFDSVSDPVEAIGVFIKISEVDKVLDAVQLLFSLIDSYIRKNDYRSSILSPLSEPNEVIDELNYRFVQHGVGYVFENGRIIRVDSTLVHSQMTQPVLNLLSSPIFQGANEEYLKAQDDYRHRKYSDCIIECLKALESTLKIICDAKKWPYSQKDTASKLIKIVIDNGLFSTVQVKNQLDAIYASLSNALPPIRNSFGSHGRGVAKVVVPPELASHALNLTASCILLIVEASGIK